jgi:hypothetical protein
MSQQLVLSDISSTKYLPYAIESVPWMRNTIGFDGMSTWPYGGIYGFSVGPNPMALLKGKKQKGGSVMLPTFARGPRKIELQEGYGKRRKHKRRRH